ncbi:uncharacterized protein F5147DRAFT_744680 [Suillus discolor]|uniref:Uncharacterized protein n=1 Tax=Suillus discolor TaxID=1912936 RepID=A0A9P7FBQ9_9AGAM|nr:uncharacterized protein F5147DRAFT_744680 [Suillus discolor]KAG2112054.1 hypothetical protein F5147DRAFT_744680 [Suillus discolor]
MPSISMFEEDDIQVQYHPNSQCQTQVFQFEDYGRGLGAPTVVPPVEPEPWYPFRTQIDCEVAELVLEAALTHQQTDRLFDLILGPHFVFDAEWLSKFNGDKFVQFIHEPWTANAFWEYQVCDTIVLQPLAFILYADKAKLLSFGRAKGYPVVARCANLPVAICNGEGLGGGHVVGWLPIVKEDKKHSGKPVYVNFKNAVWHQSFLKILACLAPLLKFGSAVKCWDDIICILNPIILILSADYEEQSVMALIHGLMGKFPCPICLVPHDELYKTSNIYPLRTSAGAKALRVQARESTTLEAREQILSSESLRDVDNSFDTMENTDLIVFAAHNVFRQDQDSEAYLLLCCIHSYKHLSVHLFDDIEAKGVTQNYNTKPNETMHGPLKDAYQDRTNFKNFTEQVSITITTVLIAEYICGKLSCLDAQNLSLLESDLPEIDSETEPTTDGLHFSLGSPQAMQSFADITEYQFLKVNYESLIDWHTEASIIFTQLLMAFTCMVRDVQYPIVLTLPYDQPVGAHPWKDKDFDFW